MHARWWGRVVLLAALACLAAACGSSTVSTTTGGGGATGTTVSGPPAAELDAACASQGMAMSGMEPQAKQATPDAALSSFLASPGAAKVRGDHFEPATPPSSYQPVQSVPANPTSSLPTTSTTTAPAPHWYAHRDAQGRVDAIIQVNWDGGWTVGSLTFCFPGGELSPTQTTLAGSVAPIGTLAPPPGAVTTTSSTPP